MTADGDWAALEWHPGVEIRNAGPEWVVVEKPAGVLSHPNRAADRSRSLLRCPYDPDSETYATRAGALALCHRLDGPTSGVLLLARPGGILDGIRSAFAEGRAGKVYRAVLVGRVARGGAPWRDRLARTRSAGGALRVVRGNSGEEAETRVTVLGVRRTVPPLSVVRLEPLTGRTHQLRVQAALRRTPVLGDATYGDFALNRKFRAKRLFLHAESLEVSLPGGLRIRASAPPPPEFEHPARAG